MPRKPPPTEPPKPAKGKPHLTVVPPASKSAPPKPRVNQHIPTEATKTLVALGVGAGYTQGQIARLVGVDEKTLRLRYEAELAEGADKINLAIVGNLASIARDRNHPKCVTAAIYWTKARMGWTDRAETPDDDDEDTGANVEVIRIGIGGAKGGS